MVPSVEFTHSLKLLRLITDILSYGGLWLSVSLLYFVQVCLDISYVKCTKKEKRKKGEYMYTHTMSNYIRVIVKD